MGLMKENLPVNCVLWECKFVLQNSRKHLYSHILNTDNNLKEGAWATSLALFACHRNHSFSFKKDWASLFWMKKQMSKWVQVDPLCRAGLSLGKRDKVSLDLEEISSMLNSPARCSISCWWNIWSAQGNLLDWAAHLKVTCDLWILLYVNYERTRKVNLMKTWLNKEQEFL